jgi:hypothetical protein
MTPSVGWSGVQLCPGPEYHASLRNSTTDPTVNIEASGNVQASEL